MLSIQLPSWIPTLDRLGLRQYGDFVNCTFGEAVSIRGSARTRRISIRDGDPSDTVYLKTYRYESAGMRMMFRRGTCRREARNYDVLRCRCGTRVPDVVAFGSRRRNGRLTDEFILTRAVPNATALDVWLEGSGRKVGGEGSKERRGILKDVAQLTARMHESGFFHVDLQLRNLLISWEESGSPALYVIDSSRGGLRWWSVTRAYGRVRDLSSLFKGARGRLSRSECLRWLRWYRGVNRLTALERAMARTILHDRRLKDPSSD